MLTEHIMTLHDSILQQANATIADLLPLMEAQITPHLESGSLTDAQNQILYDVVFKYVADSLRDAADAAKAGVNPNG
jgi:hypothetical protein